MLTLEQEIESMRNTMYQLYEQQATYDEILQISQSLDSLLNQLENRSNGMTSY
ncbi:aspartyl-phosphate phosphatase Spo0E family protein [Gracilibacillus alcaliphilus]|uniref:aspartyl-phosphate phosphatase Spo0E family protein n=1 Tax=Gracilibacillus alcaliphilus TaxID=1401441 RepID=UPI001EF960B9|nr:aspartyl-phosphate phosphatase Spo0E family protein [Gracilibacillus alcaliphilus]MBM7675523.1 sulfur transfer protein SufE [Gracilibacillus alcaliphilus]